ncbi:MAG: hypothetical protein ACLSAX_05190 [Anaerotignum sp.]|uniref:hypothetical protein n=1 Tax=Anaerotignum sp. TaxID=2039241 RepID=UPI00399492BA
MELLKQRILKDGTEIGTEVVKVDSFLKSLDIGLFMALGEIHLSISPGASMILSSVRHRHRCHHRHVF